MGAAWGGWRRGRDKQWAEVVTNQHGLINESAASNIRAEIPHKSGRNNFVVQLCNCSVLPVAVLNSERSLDIFMTATNQSGGYASPPFKPAHRGFQDYITGSWKAWRPVVSGSLLF